MATPNLSVQNWFETTLSSGITASDTTISLNNLPTGTEGYLVIDPDIPASREVVYFTSKTGSAVILPSVASGRGVDGTTATSHSSGATVRMNVVAAYWRALQDGTAITTGAVGANPYASGWTPMLGITPTTITDNGQGNYDVVFASDLTGYISPGNRLRSTRTVAAPTQCTSLNGTTQYYSKTSPSGMSFTDDFVVSAWIKVSSYTTGGTIASRFDGSSGWIFQMDTSGRISLVGLNGSAVNQSSVVSYQAVPLNKWIHVAAQLDMSAFTATTTTSYVMFNGVDVPSAVARSGTNPTTLLQAGTLVIGGRGAPSDYFPGKIAQVAIYSAKVTQATIRASKNQTLSGSETSLISAYSFNNTINDLNTTNANNLTANGSAVATNADSPFGGQADGTISSTLDYMIAHKATYSGGNTTINCQVPEGCTIPTSGGVSAVAYSANKVPYNFPAQKGKWQISSTYRTQYGQTSPTGGTWYNIGSEQLTVPTGEWSLKYRTNSYSTRTSAGILSQYVTLSTANNTESNIDFSSYNTVNAAAGTAGNVNIGTVFSAEEEVSTTTATTYYLNSSASSGVLDINFNSGKITATDAYL